MTPQEHWDKAEYYLAKATETTYVDHQEQYLDLVNSHLRMAYVGSKQGFGTDFTFGDE